MATSQNIGRLAMPHEVTKRFERALCEYTGAKYAVAVNSCTMALFLALKWYAAGCEKPYVDVPKFTYCSVPMSAIHAGCQPILTDKVWRGSYQLYPSRVWDCARRFTSGMYEPGSFQCVSFHTSKILGDSQGGAILHDNEAADDWFRRSRFDGRREGVIPAQDNLGIGWHCYLSPDVAARLLWKLSFLPKDNLDLPNSDYPDLSLQECFK